MKSVKSLKKIIYARTYNGLILFGYVISIIPSQRLRCFLYRLIGMKIGRSSVIHMFCEVRSPWKIIIGENSVIGHNVVLDGRNGITIGNNVNVSSNAQIWSMQHDPQCKYFSAVGDSVTVGDHAWISSNSVILPGRSLGEGSVLASNAVLTKTSGRYEILGGVPAKTISTRNEHLKYKLTPKGGFI